MGIIRVAGAVPRFGSGSGTGLGVVVVFALSRSALRLAFRSSRCSQ